MFLNVTTAVVFACAVIAILFAVVNFYSVKKKPEGTKQMAAIAVKIRNGAMAYLSRQYKTVAVFFAVLFVVFVIMAAVGAMSWFAPFAFVTGGFFSALAGFVGMKIATYANTRTANGARESLNRGLKIAFSSGSVMGLTVVGLGLFNIVVWYMIMHFIAGLEDGDLMQVLLTYGMGASSMALFARVGGGIFTKAADVGADLVGKVEAGIPEDDPRNPACIADNVGDNVGDVAGMGADLYESYVGSIVSCGALAVSAFSGGSSAIKAAALMLPMLIAAIGIIASVIGTFFVSTKEGATQKMLLGSLRKGTYAASLLSAIGSAVLIFTMMPDNKGLFVSVISGLLAGVLIGYFTEYYTSDSYKPTQKLSESSETGSATIIINGISLGMVSTALPVIIIGAAVLVSYFVAGGALDAKTGLYGVALAAVGMLSTLGITLATDAYGPVADNAGGIAEMSGLEHQVRERTDALDSLGNTTAATGKGFAIGSAALTALALILTYVDSIGEANMDLKVTNPAVLIGLFVGAMLPFLFSALTMKAVGRAAQEIVVEVRRQFREIKGLMEGKAEADYRRCVDICTKSALREMILPAALGIIAPLIVGFILGPNGVVGMLAGALICGFALAVMMANSGGAWDNAKKYIEAGHFGGKNSSNHKAAVVGDTVGDPFKDTSGPSVNILIKLLSMVSIVFAGLVASGNIMSILGL